MREVGKKPALSFAPKNTRTGRIARYPRFQDGAKLSAPASRFCAQARRWNARITSCSSNIKEHVYTELMSLISSRRRQCRELANCRA